MRIEAGFDVPDHPHLADAVGVFWRSRGAEVLHSTPEEIVLVRGRKGYKWVSVNPFLYYMGLKVTLSRQEGRCEFSCDAEIESDVVRNVWRDMLIREEFLLMEEYLHAVSEGRPFSLPDVRVLKLKSIWPVYVLNFLLPGWGLVYTGTFTGAYLGFCWFILSIIMGINIYLNQPIHFRNFYEVQAGVMLLLWLIGSILGTLMVARVNYERVYRLSRS